MEKKQKVLLVHNYYQIGGGEHTVFENEKNMLLENGHEVYTYTRSNEELRTSKWKLLLMPFSTIWSFKTYRDVRKLIRKKQIDVVHCHNTFPLISPSVYYAARSLKVPVIQTIHNFRFLCPNGLFYCNGEICEACREQNSFIPALKQGCYRNSRIQTAVAVAMLKFHRWIDTYKKINYIFLTEFNRNKFAGLINIHGYNIFIKPNFVQPVMAEAANRVIKAKFIYAGRLDENKGIPFLLEAWNRTPVEYELHIYGDGIYREACERAAKEHPNIHYLGFQPQNVVFADLADAAALLFPSEWYEGYPMILAESFSMGRPVVAAGIGNHGDIVGSSGGGVLFALGDKAGFEAALDEVIANNGKYSGNAYQYFLENQTKESNYRKLCDIYERAKYIK